MSIPEHTPKRPQFIVVEGLDGSGKSTLAALLADRMGAEHLSTPMRTLPSSARRDAEVMCAADPLARMLFYASTVVAASTYVRGALAAGRSVVMDRYWLSTLTYHHHLGAPTLLAEVEAALVPANVTIFLDVSTAVRRARLIERGALQAHDRMTLQPGAGEAIADHYRSFGGQLRVAGRFHALQADALSIDAVVEEALALVDES